MIYVDEPVFSKPPRFINWSHMTADTIEELHAFAERLGLKRSYFQPGKNPAGLLAHYDLSPGMRAKAVRMGAQEVHAMDQARERYTRQVAALQEAEDTKNLSDLLDAIHTFFWVQGQCLEAEYAGWRLLVERHEGLYHRLHFTVRRTLIVSGFSEEKRFWTEEQLLMLLDQWRRQPLPNEVANG